jgi:hypothetical protein
VYALFSFSVRITLGGNFFRRALYSGLTVKVLISSIITRQHAPRGPGEKRVATCGNPREAGLKPGLYMTTT